MTHNEIHKVTQMINKSPALSNAKTAKHSKV